MILGAGRTTKESVADLAVALMLYKKIGNEKIEGVIERIYASYKISFTKVENLVLIHVEVH